MPPYEKIPYDRTFMRQLANGQFIRTDGTGRPLYEPDPKWVDPRNTKERSSHPYSYSEFFIFGSRQIIAQEGVHGEYSDRLQQWNGDKFREALKESGVRQFSEMTKAKATKFLTTYHGKPTTCVALAEGCNQSSGYPYWIFWHTQP